MPNKRRRLQGVVVGNKMDKTVKVQVERTSQHPLYGKVLRRYKTYYAHDEANALEIGDVVIIVESRPISKLKRWVVEEVIEHVHLLDTALQEEPRLPGEEEDDSD